MTLQLEQLTLGYRHRPVIRQLTLPAIVRGSLVAVVGPNAVGKSTLLKGIAGLVPAKGSVSLDDLALLSLPSRQRLAKIGYLPQALPQRVPLVAYETVVSAYRSLGSGTSLGVDEAVERVFDTLGIRLAGAAPARPALRWTKTNDRPCSSTGASPASDVVG